MYHVRIYTYMNISTGSHALTSSLQPFLVMSRKDETNVKAKCIDVPAEDEYWEIQLIVNFTDYFVTIMHMFTSARVDISNVNTVECLSTVETHRRGELCELWSPVMLQQFLVFVNSC